MHFLKRIKQRYTGEKSNVGCNYYSLPLDVYNLYSFNSRLDQYNVLYC